MDLKKLEVDVIKETKELEERAFKLFVKDFIKQDLEHIDKAQIALDKIKIAKNERNLEYYKNEYNKRDMRSGTCNTYREVYLDKVK